jgi:hypothetical protein
MNDLMLSQQLILLKSSQANSCVSWLKLIDVSGLSVFPSSGPLAMKTFDHT